jgi:hypothetical protein
MCDPGDPDHVYIGRENRWYSLAGSTWRATAPDAEDWVLRIDTPG